MWIETCFDEEDLKLSHLQTMSTATDQPLTGEYPRSSWDSLWANIILIYVELRDDCQVGTWMLICDNSRNMSYEIIWFELFPLWQWFWSPRGNPLVVVIQGIVPNRWKMYQILPGIWWYRRSNGTSILVKTKSLAFTPVLGSVCHTLGDCLWIITFNACPLPVIYIC